MPNSDFYPSRKRSVGALLLSKDGSACQRTAVFWRYGDYLVTARHVADGILSGTFNVYASDVVENRNKNWFVNRKNLYKFPSDFFDEENNLLNEIPTLDLFVCEFDWKASKLAIQKTATRTSLYNQNVQTVGFNEDGLLVASLGLTLKGSGPLEIHHTASTLQGHSGSPIYSGSAVVGIHVRAFKKYNVAIRIEAMLYYLQIVCGGDESKIPEFEEVHGVLRVRGRASKWSDLLIDQAFDKFQDSREGVAVVEETGQVYYGVKNPFVSKVYDPMKNWGDYADPEMKPYETVEEESEIVDLGFCLEYPRQKPVHSSITKRKTGPFAAVVSYETAAKVGYDKDSVSYPNTNPSNLRDSLLHHLEMSYNSFKSSIEIPADIKSKAVKLLTERMQGAKFIMKSGYKSPANLEDYYNSRL